MREIKFRAFTEDKEFIYWSIGDTSNWFWEQVRCDNLIVQQFTGLKDKNSKEIYEGDIIDGLIVSYSGNQKEGLGMNVGWYLQRDDFESWSELESSLDYEVQGNIYENPELILKGEK